MNDRSNEQIFLYSQSQKILEQRVKIDRSIDNVKESQGSPWPV